MLTQFFLILCVPCVRLHNNNNNNNNNNTLDDDVMAEYLICVQPDVEGAVHGRFHDSAISVREASIDLVGRFLTVQRDLTAQYYPMLAERILVSQSCRF